ncbi:hypothetical protein AB595_26130 [Massilia sp. WF1]|uniref:DUF2946 family protein n=1 Tax=unclassified Massilia TaxID=2609279 RepID=UPI00068CFB4C|nr:MULTISPECIES: DUF2946 family protein [unclassified Massilia]ALK99025.1 hypothetical protein AM586_25325 [Massilia sp. WG5]KNZ67621.1 hypothetical protein AB595_26130 [Massilia sp. WF1]
MDDIVIQAMAKWPNVPHCYGWLALDARGAWRMRDEAAQRAGAPGDKLTNATLVGFIKRNYQHDERGCWYFQNGPQRVYVNLEATPFIARTDPGQGFILHTGEAMPAPEQVFMLEAGNIVLRAGDRLAQVDDRDVAQLLQAMELDGKPVGDDALLAWLEGGPGRLALRWQGREIAVERLAADEAPQRFGFVQAPTSATTRDR